MGKSNKPTKWFKAVKKAFRSPSKDRPASPDLLDTKSDADEKLLSKHYDRSPVRHHEPTPHPLPSFEIITHDEASEPEHSRGQAFPQPLPTPEAVDPAIHPSDKRLENVIEEEENNHGSNGVETVQVVAEEQQQDDDEESISEEEEAAARIRQRFSEPLALKGLIRLQGLVRGHQVRRQAATTLQTIEAIVRVQAVFRGRRTRMSKDGRAVRSRISKRRRLSSRMGLHVDASRGGLQYNEPVIFRSEPEAYKPKRPPAYLLTQQLKRSAPKRSTLYIGCDPRHPLSGGWEWLKLWSNARPWELRTVEAPKGSSNSKDFIEIIPSRKNTSEYTAKEVDVTTLKVKYFEDYVSNPTPAKSRSSNPTSESKKESSTKSSPSPGLFEKKESVKLPSPAAEKKEPGSKSSSPMTERKEPVAKSSSPMSERKEHASKYSSPMSEKKEPLKSASPMAEKKEPTRSSSLVSEKREPFRSARALPEKKELNRSSSSPILEKKEARRASLSSPFSEKKEPASSRSPSSPFSEKKEPVRASSTSSSEKEPPRASFTSFPEKKERPTSPLSEKSEPGHGVTDWPQTTRAPTPSPLPTPTSPPPPPAPNGHRVIPKPPPIELPSQQIIFPAMVEEDRPIIQVFEPGTPEAPKSPVREKSMPPSPAVSENSLPIMPLSPQASDASLPVPETPPGLDSNGDDPSVTMEHLLLPEAQSVNGDTNGAVNGEGHSSSCLSASNREHQHGEDTASAKGSASDVANGLGSNGAHQENGDSKSSAKEEKGRGESNNGDSPGPSKRPTCRYMVPTASAKAKFRSSSNPKTRVPETPESPVRTTPKRYSIGGSPTVVGSKGTDSPKTAFGTRKTPSFQNRGTPSPKATTPKEKPARSVETGSESPARRNSLGGDKRWRT